MLKDPKPFGNFSKPNTSDLFSFPLNRGDKVIKNFHTNETSKERFVRPNPVHKEGIKIIDRPPQD